MHTRFSHWAESGVWAKLFAQLSADAVNEYAMIDSTIVRAHQHSAGAPKKMTRTRRSAAVKEDGAPRTKPWSMLSATRSVSCSPWAGA